LLAWWALDDGQGTLAQDRSGNGFNGLLRGGARFQSFGRVGSGSLALPALLRSSVEMPFVAIPEAETRALWVRTTSSLSAMSLLSYGRDEPGSQLAYEFRLLNGCPQAFVFDGLVAHSFGGPGQSAAVNDGLWHHVAFVRDSSNNAQLYVDAQLQGSRAGFTVGGLGLANSLDLGRRHVGQQAALYYDGELDDVRLYPASLSQMQMAELGKSCVGGFD